jgi:outer membrane murein-binding lipoprotein Lpp
VLAVVVSCAVAVSHTALCGLAVVCTVRSTYAQAMTDVRQLTGALQVLTHVKEHLSAYVEAAKQELQLAHDGT